MYTENLPTRVIDLQVDSRLRWESVIRKDNVPMHALAEQAMDDLSQVTHLVRSPTLHWLFRSFIYNGMYMEELKSLAEGLGVSASLAAVLNQSYELSHFGTHISIFGCTAAVKRTTDRGMVLTRNMDWPLPGIGRATRIFKFVNGSREFVSVGVAGYVGVLSGMLPGAYAAVLNWAPPGCSPDMEKCSPPFLLRRVLEQCDTYQEAVRMLSRTQLSTSAFFTVCGVRKGEGCVVERTQRRSFIRHLEDDCLVQANHFSEGPFRFINQYLDEEDDTEVLDFSRDRERLLRKRLGRVTTMRGAFRALDADWVLNDSTVQQMTFCPSTGEARIGCWT